jgi:hypothetical protein
MKKADQLSLLCPRCFSSSPGLFPEPVIEVKKPGKQKSKEGENRQNPETFLLFLPSLLFCFPGAAQRNPDVWLTSVSRQFQRPAVDILDPREDHFFENA